MRTKRQPLTEEEKEFLHYADTLSKKEPEEFFLLASGILGEKEVSVSFFQGLVRRVYRTRDVLAKQGSVLAYDYNKLYEVQEERAERDYDICAPCRGEYWQTCWNFSNDLIMKLMQKGDHEAAMDIYAESYGLVGIDIRYLKENFAKQDAKKCGKSLECNLT